jgi:hypothetical protein
LDRLQRPFFRRGEGRVDEGFTQIDLSAIAEIFREALEQPIEAPAALPELEASMTGLIWRIAPRQIMPRRPGPQHPEHAVEHRARIAPRPTASIGATPRRTECGFEHGPLGVSEVHAVEYDGDRNFVHRPRWGFMR